MSKLLATLILSLAVCTAASAGQKDKDKDDHGWGQDQHEGWNGKPVKAPEIDPASAASGLTLLLCGLAVMRGRREKK